MKIAIIGYGKMGRLIEELSLKRGHEIAGVVDDLDWNDQQIKNADIAVEFTSPESALNNIYRCFQLQIPIVVGTTGWYDDFDTVVQKCKQLNGALLTATNFSLGVNIFYEINKKLASLMNLNHQYKPKLYETHHIQKLDSPSGTAITIAEDMISRLDGYQSWLEADNVDEHVLGIKATRKPDVPGTHRVEYESEVDKIVIEHEAMNRNGFALGAVIAAEFLADKKGVYTMKEVLGL